MQQNNKLETLIIEGVEFKTILSNSFKNRKAWTKPNHQQILSHIPGNILKIFVKEGQAIKAGDKLLILEAMKMENIISAKQNGVVKKIYVTEGEQIPKGNIMLELES